MLHYLVRRFIIPLHCPFANEARGNPLFYYSLKVGMDAAMAIVSPEPDEAFSRLMAIGGGLFREGLRLAATVICLELIAQIEAQRLDGTLHRNSQHRDLLKQTVKDMISSSAERIRQGETNIKSHLFLSMILAQAESMEAGTPCEFKFARSARDSLEFCRDLLQTQVGSVISPCPHDTAITSTSWSDGQEDYELDLGLDFYFPDASFS